MSNRFEIVLTDHAREAAEMWSSCSAVETAARREIAALFGDGLDLARYFHGNMTTIRIWMDHADERFVLMPRDPRTWEVATLGDDPPCPPYPIFFSDRAMAMIAGLGWDIGAIEDRARLALKCAHPPDYGFCEFQVPLEEVAFTGSLTADGTVEIDLDDWRRENVGT